MNNKLALFLFAGLAVSLLSACSIPDSVPETPQEKLSSATPEIVQTMVPSATTEPSITKTVTRTSTPSSTSTASLTASPTVKPTITPTPTPTTIPLGVPLPTSAAIISAENAKQLIPLARLGRGWLNELTWSPDGKLLAVASSTGIQLYDAKTLVELKWIETDYYVECVEFSPDGAILASGSYDAVIRLWSVSDGELLRDIYGSIGEVEHLVFSPDGTVLASVSSRDKFISLWRVSDGARLKTFQRPEVWDWNSIAFSSDGTTLASGTYEGIYFWQVSDGSIIRKLDIPVSWDSDTSFSQDWQFLAVVQGEYPDDKVNLWRVSDGKLLDTFQRVGGGQFFSIGFAPDGSSLAAGTERGIILWQVSDGKVLKVMPLREGEYPRSIAFSPDGNALASGTGDHSIRIWQIANATIQIADGRSGWISDLSFSPDGELLSAANSNSESARVWRVIDGALLYSLSDAGNQVVFSPDGSILASSSFNDTLSLWRAVDGDLLRAIQEHSSIYSLAFSPIGEWIAAGIKNDSIIIFQTGTGLVDRILRGIPIESRVFTYTSSVIYSPDGELIAAGSSSGDVYLWNVNEDQPLLTLKGHIGAVTSIAFSPDGTRLITSSWDETIRLWSIPDGELLRILYGHMGTIHGVAFSPDGNILAASGDYGAIRLWQAFDGASLIMVKTPWNGQVKGIAFSPDGRILAAGGSDQTVWLYGIP